MGTQVEIQSAAERLARASAGLLGSVSMLERDDGTGTAQIAAGELLRGFVEIGDIVTDLRRIGEKTELPPDRVVMTPPPASGMFRWRFSHGTLNDGVFVTWVAERLDEAISLGCDRFQLRTDRGKRQNIVAWSTVTKGDAVLPDSPELMNLAKVLASIGEHGKAGHVLYVDAIEALLEAAAAVAAASKGGF